MKGLARLTATEFALLRRDLPAIGLPFVLPLGLLVGFGSATDLREPAEELGGMSAFDVHIVPIALVLVLPLMAIMVFPVALATYRERGVLRRLATTPIHPLAVLVAQLVIHVGVLVTSLGVTAVVARVAFDVAAPRHPAVGLGVLGLGILAVYAVGVAIAAIAPAASTATAAGMGLFFPQLLLGGLMVPVDQLPDALARVGGFTPVGATMHALQDAWVGEGLRALHPLVLVVWTIVAVGVAVARFRWD